MSVLKKEWITKKAAKQGVELFMETLIDCMIGNEKVMFNNFGRFEMKTLEQRKGRLPLGGECIIPEHKKMKFYPSRALSKKIEDMQEG